MSRHHMVVAAAVLAFTPVSAAAQGLANRIAAAPDGRVQFTFPARSGVCGNGRSFFSIEEGSYQGSFINTSDPEFRASCAPGPVRVVLDRADRQVVSLRTYVGPVDTTSSGTTDLGRVSPADAADYLLALAASSEGAASRDAILPASIAEGVDATSRLLGIARDAARPAETRRSALSWVAREAESAAQQRAASEALLAITRDDVHPRTVRQGALSALARLGGGAGVPPVIALARDAGDGWLAREAVAALSRSGDPRARAGLRDIVERGTLPDEVMATAVRALGGQYATSRDAELVRSVYAKLPGERSRSAAVTALAEIGGEANVRWLLAIARDQGERESVRRSALSAARRGGASSGDVASLYDSGDNAMRSMVVTALAESSDRAAIDKLLAIARSGDDRTIRRRAVTALAKVDDPRVRAALADIVER